MEQHLCASCFENITHPICPSCYLKHMEYWLRDLGGDFDKKVLMQDIKKALAVENLNDDRCIICGKDGLSLCSYCAFLKVSRVLVKLDFDEKIRENFSEIFNYKIDETQIV